MKRKIGVLLTLFVVFIFSAACSSEEETDQSTEASYAQGMKKEPYTQEEFLLGTYTRIRVFDEDKEDVLQPAFDRIKELEDKITINQSGSEIDEINENAGEKPVKVSKDIYDLLKQARDYSEKSDGGFNLMVGAITQLWRIGFDDARKPSQDEIDEALKHVDYNDIVFDDDKQTVYLEDEDAIIDLGAIAKGYIADEAVAVLKEHDVKSAIVDLGGNIYVVGHSNRGENEDWTVGIQDPNDERGSVLGSIKESDKTIVTSGIYERYLEVDGESYHHLFDAETGYPYDNDIASATVITDKSIDGDGLTTVIFDKGVKDGLKYIEDNTPEGTSAVFVTKEDKVYMTEDIEDSFELDEDSGYSLGDRSELQ
ncbi:FAD:protein FMN transferase [Tetragenococcus halophilus]|uniref:FAD:protein FMN transferase n=1 Tax=Tetragenococcus halophilus TaxID=51669 RepID=UPI00077CB05D|nr:FAD:protein FMN transferase [Tetragenococcus halophilus]MCO8286838.1 FAD:protein FMN transferase [Tetragenococcus halophilus]GMQ73749.1 FAD:protein FMN transferase [Tetragenococcus halophilus]